MYGTRDAGRLWEKTYRLALEDIGFKTELANPCLVHHDDHNIRVVVHGDDFAFLGADDRLNGITDELTKVLEIKVRAGYCKTTGIWEPQ